MRKVDFRFWNVKSQSMRSWQVMKSHIDIGMFLAGEYLEYFIPMQYTGLQDKNGNKIYEGDICKDGDGNKYEVVFERGVFKLIGLGSRFIREDTEVIGNIYENAELTEVV